MVRNLARKTTCCLINTLQVKNHKMVQGSTRISLPGVRMSLQLVQRKSIQALRSTIQKVPASKSSSAGEVSAIFSPYRRIKRLPLPVS